MPAELAYGFVGLQHLFDRRIQEVGVPMVYTAVQQSVRHWTMQTNELMSDLVERTTIVQEQYELPGNKRMQPLDEYGIPRPSTVGGNYQIAYPIQGAGDAWGRSRITNALMTVAEANRQTIEIQKADARWLVQHILAAILYDQPWTFHDKVGPNGNKGLGDVTVMPLANGDAIEYNKLNGESETTTHYMAQADPISDANNPFPAIRKRLTGYEVNRNATIVCYIPENLEASVTALSDFVEVSDPDIQLGANQDRLRRRISTGFGDEVLGKVDGVWIVKWLKLPDNYILARAMGTASVLKMREYPASSLQGLFTELYSPDGARSEIRYLRYAGFGVANRLGALVYKVGAATYEPPADFANVPIA